MHNLESVRANETHNTKFAEKFEIQTDHLISTRGQGLGLTCQQGTGTGLTYQQGTGTGSSDSQNKKKEKMPNSGACRYGLAKSETERKREKK